MRLLAGAASVASAFVIAAATWPAAVGADQAQCAPGVTGPSSANPGGVNIHLGLSSVTWCSAAVITNNKDIADGTIYRDQATSSSPNDNPVSNAISIAHLLTIAGVDPANVNLTAVPRLNGTWSTLDNADLVDPSSHFLNGLSPIIWIDGTTTHYLRAQRSPNDTNAEDSISAQSGAAIDLYVYTGPVLTVTVAESASHTIPGRPVSFFASVTNKGSAAGALRYKWSFGDGQTTQGPADNARHKFSQPGTYLVYVTAEGANNSGGVSVPAQVIVGRVPKGRSLNPPGGKNPSKSAPSSGPSSSGGATPGGTPTKNATHSSPKAKHGEPHPAASAHPAPSTDTSPAQTAPPQRHTARTTPARHRESTSDKRVQVQPHQRGGTVVEGRLISDVTPVSPAQLENPAGSGTTQAYAPSARLGGDVLTPVAGLAGACGIILLLGSGAGRELRSVRRSHAAGRLA